MVAMFAFHAVRTPDTGLCRLAVVLVGDKDF
jgi:hypothetical protein